MSRDTAIATELRQLAFRIEQLGRESNVASIANDQVRALADYLTLRARVIELETEVERLQTLIRDMVLASDDVCVRTKGATVDRG